MNEKKLLLKFCKEITLDQNIIQCILELLENQRKEFPVKTKEERFKTICMNYAKKWKKIEEERMINNENISQ